MLTDEALLLKAKRLIEEKVCWGDSDDWANQDFIALRGKIQDEIGISISHVTLKRLWGKVKYDGLPQTYTLNTLVQFIGYESWRDFKVKNGSDAVGDESASNMPVTDQTKSQQRTRNLWKPVSIGITIAALFIGFVLFVFGTNKPIDPKDYTFSSRETRKAGIPNSVVFDFDATKAPSDSVVLQQSWDTRLRTTVSKNDRQHTLIYYFPGYFKPKLIVNGRIVKEHNLLVKSDGWLAAFIVKPMPIYFKKQDFIANGKMGLPVDKIKAQDISLTPQAPLLSYCNVQDFGEIYTDNFNFETSLRNDYKEGSSVCQLTNIYLLCEGTAVGIPLCAKGCESSLNFFFTNYNVSGKQTDLSNFGVDFNSYVKVRVESANGRAKIFLDNKLAYEVKQEIAHSKIIGVDFVFQGTGSVDYVRLSNQKVNFDDEF